MKIRPNSRVELEYSILGPDGTVFESSEELGPLVYVHGADDLPEEVQSKLAGRSDGDEIEVAFGAGEIFGDYDIEAIVSVPRSEFPDDAELVPGDSIAIDVEDDDGSSETMEARVVEARADEVVIDANHPLAGKESIFRARVLSVRPAEES